MDTFIWVLFIRKPQLWLSDPVTTLISHKTHPEKLCFVLGDYYHGLNIQSIYPWDTLAGWRRNRCSRLSACCCWRSVGQSFFSVFCPLLGVYIGGGVSAFCFAEEEEEEERSQFIFSACNECDNTKIRAGTREFKRITAWSWYIPLECIARSRASEKIQYLAFLKLFDADEAFMPTFF